MSGFGNIKGFIFDVDGVLTDGSVQSFADGEHVRRFYIKDGYAMEKAIQSGYPIAIISGGFEDGVKNRLTFLGVKDIFLGIKDKIQVFSTYTTEHDIDPKNILYMGDDIPDLKVLKLVGLPACPADAAPDVLSICKYISPYEGGRGAVRDVIEKVMKAQGKWDIDKW